MGACILQGVKIGERAIVGAGAVVLKDVPQNTTAVGVPAKIIKLDKESINDTIIITTLNNT